MATNDTLIFLHIPKTAGSTFHSILNKKYKESQVQNVFGSRYTAPEIASFIKQPLEEKANIRMLKGHMPFGLHEYLPSSAKYIAFLRDPVERIISLYYYIIKNHHNPLHEAVVDNNMSLSDFVTSGIAIGANNGQCRFINGDIDEYGFNQCDESLYLNAVKHIKENFLWMGMTERFDESILLLTELMEWERPPYYFRGNTSKIRKGVSQIDSQVIKIMEQYNTFDRRLYIYVNQLMDEQISNTQNFSEKLAMYKSENESLQSRWGWLPDSIRRIIA